jgi:hypothetical protein
MYTATSKALNFAIKLAEERDIPAPGPYQWEADIRKLLRHLGLLLNHSGLIGCDICECLVDTDPRFAAALIDHMPDGTPSTADIDPPSPAAGLLDTMITDMTELGDNTACNFGQVADTCPAGIGAAAVYAHDTVTGGRHVIVCVDAREAVDLLDDDVALAKLWRTLVHKVTDDVRP